MDKLAEEILCKTINVELHIVKKNTNGIWGLTFNEALKAMQSYHEAKLKEELIEFSLMINTNLSGDKLITKGDIDEYLKKRNNGTIS